MEEEDRGCDYAMREAVAAEEDEGHRVMEWEVGLPGSDDLMPLSQALISPELASAFSISPEPRCSALDVNRASQDTISSLRRTLSSPPFSAAVLKQSYGGAADEDAEMEENSARDVTGESRKMRRVDLETTAEDAESGSGEGGGGDNCADDNSARTLKRPRLVWAPQLHKRFVDVVTHLGIKKAVPKTIMQLMNVEGLTRENVASHLQKYRLYLKRQGLPYEGPSNSDQLFPSTPTASQSLQGEPGGSMPIPGPYGPPLMPMPVMGMAQPHGPGGQLPMPINNHQATAAAAAAASAAAAYHHGFQSHPYGMYGEPHKDWPGSGYGSMVSYPQSTRGDK